MFRLVVYALLAVLLIAYVYPLYFVVIASISDPNAVYNGEVLFLPAQMTLEGYEEIFHYGELWIGYLNSIFYTVAGVFINISVTMMAAYALSRKEMMLRGVILKLFMFTMFFGGGLIPTYLLVKSLGLLDSRWVLLLNGAVSVYNLIITRTFLVSTLPEELHEAATMDGCRETRYLISVVLPLSGAIIGVNALYYGAGHWNSYFSALIYIRDKQLQPLQLILRSILLSTRVSLNEFEDPDLLEGKIGLEFLVKFALIVVSSAPIMCLYPFVQKFFAKGVMLGSVKG